MTFRPEEVDFFLSNFGERKELIRNFEGCTDLKLMRDINQPNIFFTYSKWENEQALELYRKSELFISTWGIVKLLFSAKPEAWSVEILSE
jgi:quinol monooxygenase YgiN